MPINAKRDLKRIWEQVKPIILFPESVELTDVEYSFGWDRTTYILTELNNTPVFFIFDTEGPYVQMFTHKHIPRDLVEVAISIKNKLTNHVYSKQIKLAKISKSD